ncbi:hypothetical protein ZIOFF_007722 [Zingiber officinale]|uniref:Protein kinase domain-containing protein n=1 Tax=Zingiber officinale TaxID=94328 RepID=A0A8J5I265_ZINOF|nr:hypothetical protein ZIOFF_007722 [Zingiber officinale]
MGMNLESGELLAVKQVLIGTSSASKEKSQAHIWELEEEVKLLKNLSHPNIVGANILVDNKGCIKLADFGASKQVAKLNALSFFALPLTYYNTCSADIWSVGCTVIEMATGKPPWSQQCQEVAALFHIGTTKSHPPIPEHLSSEAKDFLLKCLQKCKSFLLSTVSLMFLAHLCLILQREPKLRSSTSDLLQHPFVTKEFKDLHPMHHSHIWEPSRDVALTSKLYTKSINNDGDKLDKNGNSSRNCSIVPGEFTNVKPIWELSNSSDMCRLDDIDDFPIVGSSFNPMSEPFDERPPQKFDVSPEHKVHLDDSHEPVIEGSCTRDGGDDFAFSSEPVDDDKLERF